MRPAWAAVLSQPGHLMRPLPQKLRAGEVAWKLRALVLEEDRGLVPSLHADAHVTQFQGL